MQRVTGTDCTCLSLRREEGEEVKWKDVGEGLIELRPMLLLS